MSPGTGWLLAALLSAVLPLPRTGKVSPKVQLEPWLHVRKEIAALPHGEKPSLLQELFCTAFRWVSTPLLGSSIQQLTMPEVHCFLPFKHCLSFFASNQELMMPAKGSVFHCFQGRCWVLEDIYIKGVSMRVVPGFTPGDNPVHFWSESRWVVRLELPVVLGLLLVPEWRCPAPLLLVETKYPSGAFCV